MKEASLEKLHTIWFQLYMFWRHYKPVQTDRMYNTKSEP